MDHLEEYGEPGTVSRLRVPLIVDSDTLGSPECKPESFSFAHFHDFPACMGWEIVEGRLKELKADRAIKRRPQLLQAWLFFGLVFTVVRTDKGSLLNAKSLLLPRDSGQIGTSELRGRLKEWAAWETSPERDEGETRMRMLRIGLVLEKARKIVRNHCSVDDDDDDYETWDEEKKYTTQPGKKHEERYMDDEVALSLMLLGETLSAVHGNIMKKNHKKALLGVSGWHTEDISGWGRPRYVLKQMRKEKWCPQTIYLLRRQLGLHATLLLNAYYSHRESAQVRQDAHDDCKPQLCTVKSHRENEVDVYSTSHHEAGCIGASSCDAMGPASEEISAILDRPESDDGVFPLVRLRFKADDKNVIEGLDVLEGGRATSTGEYATISHVWSDGYGNEEANEVWLCQLYFIQRLLERAVGNAEMPFWMDTLIIPVGQKEPEARKRKKKAIQQIHNVFKGSKCTIVLDKGLISMDLDKAEPCLTAMKILASGWMRRLWTLQEAFLSKSLKIAFNEKGTGVLADFNELRDEVKTQARTVTSVMAALIKKEMASSIMDRERGRRDAYGSESESDDEGVNCIDKGRSLVIADAWRAARWRTTSNRAHETLALATLLGLQVTKDSSDRITEAGMKNFATKERQGIPTTDLELLMKDFWTTMDRFQKGCIPPGIIFLPGTRMTLKGFGWAPKTFMTPNDIGHPNPLALLTQPTTLKSDHGLMLACPGFLLHFDKTALKIRTDILSTTEKIRFPVDSSFLEWYHVTPDAEPGYAQYQGPSIRDSSLGIIMSRPSPRESPAETGLLVEIYKPETLAADEQKIRFAQILFRVKIRREGPQPTESHFRDSNAIFGEIIPSTQKWCVDGYQPGRFPSQNHLEASQGSGGKGGMGLIRASTMMYSKLGLSTGNEKIGPSVQRSVTESSEVPKSGVADEKRWGKFPKLW